MVLVAPLIHISDAHQITDRKVLSNKFSTMNFVEIGQDYKKFKKRFLMPTLINRIYSSSDEV